MKNKNIEKVEIIKVEKKKVEVRYFYNSKDISYLSWQLPLKVVEELIFWREKNKENKVSCFPFITRSTSIEIRMNTEQYVYVRERDKFGSCKMSGWFLPVSVLDELCVYSKK